MYTVKVALDDDVRRIRANSWADLDAQVKDRFQIAGFVAKYTDEEGDMVKISSESELEDASTSKTGETLRLFITSATDRDDKEKAAYETEKHIDANSYVSVDLPASESIEKNSGYTSPVPRPTPRMAPPPLSLRPADDDKQASEYTTNAHLKYNNIEDQAFKPQRVPVPGPVPVPPHSMANSKESASVPTAEKGNTPTPTPGPKPTRTTSGTQHTDRDSAHTSANTSRTDRTTSNDTTNTTTGEDQPNLYNLGVEFMNCLGVDLNAMGAGFGMNGPNTNTQQRQVDFTADANGANTTQNAPDFARAAGTFVEALPMMMNAFNTTMQSMNASANANAPNNDATYTGSHANSNPTGNAYSNSNVNNRAPQMPTAADMAALAQLFGVRRYE
ncbi:hypothetical protein SARC_08033 [Sphaeroforma arctica JP610]|uniref:PB1 domain-containing protein n=1 Tax=Sphaeroforma arctica JP610 TaxID=667725 RepID=A0A0L0FS18_9EUKA|nr:hypothetical protein SARC_08033 [Sphaeroforma arctica JP610]KNC79572.1 hypothetical protein SARC_08033 [Sphaeroforma arctica JP610]|eukprot:XP_014153474.1 hypothetical protein SARC_08033 [Sphaeroforma arctica JP610]